MNINSLQKILKSGSPLYRKYLANKETQEKEERLRFLKNQPDSFEPMVSLFTMHETRRNSHNNKIISESTAAPSSFSDAPINFLDTLSITT